MTGTSAGSKKAAATRAKNARKATRAKPAPKRAAKK
jgi:hypothetical protein